MVTAAALCSLALGLGFGLPALFGTLHFAQTGEVWTFMGFPAYGGGPFEQIGLPTSGARDNNLRAPDRGPAGPFEQLLGQRAASPGDPFRMCPGALEHECSVRSGAGEEHHQVGRTRARDVLA